MSTFTKVAAAAIGLLLAARAGAADVRNKVDWPKFLSRHDLVYARLPEKWGEGAFTGNGLLGAMVYKTDDGKALRFRIGRSDVMVQGAGSPHRLPIGDLVLVPQGTITGGTMRLDLWNAEVTGTVKTDKGEIAFRTFTHATDLVQVIDLRPSEGERGCQWRFEPGIAMNPRDVKDAISKKEPIPPSPNPEPVIATSGDIHTVDQKLRIGGGHATAWRVVGETEPRRTLFLSVGWGDDALQQATTTVAKAANGSVAALEQSHRDWWHAFYPASFLSVPDTRLESFYWIQMYKLASATRADRPAIDLMGPWFNETPWPRIWWNLNIQLTYYPVYASNHLDLGESLCRMIDAGKENLAKNAKEFSDDSETVARTTGYDCRGNGGNELCDYPWALHNYYMQYRYSMDDAMLRDRLLPRMRRAMNYYYHFMQAAPDGKLHVTRGYSPEYPQQPTPNPDCNIDLALVRWICGALIDSCERLKIDDPLLPKWKDTLARLTPYPTDENGLRVSASVPWAQSHRHYSHLLMIYPLYVMNWDQPENRDLINKSFDHWVNMPEAFRGYSYTGAASICAQIGRNNETAKYLHFFVDAKGKYGLLPNTHYTEAGPVIETPLSGARTMQDMLIQSWGGTIRVFPGVPDDWKDVTFDKLRAEGAFLVSASRKNGKAEWVRVESLAGEPCHVKAGMGEVDSNRPIKPLGDGVVELQLNKGESALLWPKGSRPAEAAVEMVDGDGKVNTFGLPQ